MPALDWLNSELATLSEQGLLRRKREVCPLPQGQCVIDGRKLWNFAANDYLGLAGDPRLIAAAEHAMREGGIGSRASPLVTGRSPWHVRLEQRLAEFKQAEAAILFPTGFAANFGTILSLVGPDDIVFCDRLNHASLVDGCRFSHARFRVYPHCKPEALRNELQKATTFRRRLIVTDSLFSMDGDHAPLAELHDLAEEFDAMLLVDEAHATGVYGERGTGLLETHGIHSERVITVGTLSKGIGLQGGFVTGGQRLIDWLWNSARTQVFSTGLSIPVCAAAEISLDLIQQEPERRRWLLQQAELVQQTLREQGWEIPESAHGPIVPVITKDPQRTLELARQLEDLRVLVGAIRPPTVPKGTARLRISLSEAHGPAGIQALLQAMQQLRSEMVTR